jgi:hypothetical protein
MERASTGTTRNGLVVGFIAYAAVAVFYSAFDVLASRGPLYTVNSLGRALFRGVRDTGALGGPVQIDLPAVLLYNGIHLLVAVIIGLVVVWLVDRAVQHPPHAALMMAVIVAGFVATIFAVGWLTEGIRPVLPWWSIVLANTFAVLAAVVYLRRRRPGLLGLLLSH